MTNPADSSPKPAQGRPTIATLRDLVIIAFYYRKMVVTILAVGTVLAIIGWGVSPIRFTAKLQLMLMAGSDSTNAMGLATGNLAADTTRMANSESEFLRNRAFLTKVVEQIGPERIDDHLGERRWFGLRPSLPPEDQLNNAVDILQRSLWVTTPTDTNLMIVSFQHKNRDTAISVVDTLADLYLQRRGEIYNNLKSPFLKDKAKTYGKQLESIEEAIRAEKEKSNVLDLTQEITFALDHVNGVTIRLQTASEHRAGLLAEIVASRNKLRELPGQIFDYSETNDHVDNGEGDNQLLKLYVERDRVQQLYQPDDPHIKDVTRQIDILEKAKNQPKRQFSINRQARNPAVDFMTNHLMQLEVEADAAEKSIAELSTQLASSQQRVDELRNAENKLRALDRSRAVTDQLYRDFTQRAEAAQSEEAAAALKNANIRIVASGDASLRGESSRYSLALAILIAAFIVAVAAALFSDWNRQVVLLPQEIEHQLQLPVLATFNDGQDFQSRGNAAQVIFLAGQLVFNRPPNSAMQKIQIVSQGASEYRQEFALALATELAVGQNMRTLLLDLVEDGKGQWRSLKEPATKRTISGFGVAASAATNLDVTIGATHADINWLRANKGILESLLEPLRADYDMIVIDAPPFRDGIVPVRLATIVDGSILVIRAEHTKRSVMEVLLSQLLSAQGDVYGAVLTGRKFYIPRIIYRWL